MELYRKVRLACADGMSARAAARHFNISRGTVEKALAFSIPPGYRRTAAIKRPKLDGFTEIIEAWLEADKAVHRKQRHTANRIFERLRAEHGFTGGYTIIKDYVRERERRGQEMFVPLAHPPGDAQADFGEAVVVIDGVEQKAHFFVMDPLHYLPLIERKINSLDQAAPLAEWDLPEAFRTLRRLMEARMLKMGRREYVQVLRLLEVFDMDDLHAAVKKALKLDSFDFKAIPKLNKMQVLELARCEWVDRRENDIALGPSGTGKTHVALGLGLAACQKGMSVSFTTAAALVNELMEARDERRLLRLQKQMAAVKLLIIDELGFVPLSKTGAELLFELISQRYERGATLITSNLPFDEWTETFGTERLTGALLDRLTHHVNILEMNGESYRLAQSRAHKAKDSA